MAKPFQFQNSFDATERGMIAARDFTLEDLAAARQEGFDEGKAAGLAEAKASIDQVVGAALSEAGRGLQTLGPSLDTMRAEIESDALMIVTRVMEKVIPYMASKHGLEEVEALVQECLSAAYEEPRIVVRAHETILGPLADHLDQLTTSCGFNGNVVLLEDQTLAAGDCRVEWADGGAERDVDRVWAEIESAIARFTEVAPEPTTGVAAE